MNNRLYVVKYTNGTSALIKADHIKVARQVANQIIYKGHERNKIKSCKLYKHDYPI
jgi:hypothetical protein